MNIIYSPEWFYGIDMIIDLFSILVLSLITIFSLKCYKINKKNKNYFWLAMSFMILAISFLFKILTHFTIYYDIIREEALGFFSLTYKTVAILDILYAIGFLGYMFLSLIGLLILYEIYQKNRLKQNIILLIYFIMIASYFSTSKYFVFHLTSLVMFIFITLNYFKNSLKKRTRTSNLLAFSFLIITISQLIFIFIVLNTLLYVFAEITQLLGYVLLLITFIEIVKNAKKK